MGLVHMYPFLPHPFEFLELIAEQQGLKGAPVDPVHSITDADWEALLAYCAKVTAVDMCDHVPLSVFKKSHAQSSDHDAVSSSPNSGAIGSQMPSPQVQQAPPQLSHSYSLSPDCAPGIQTPAQQDQQSWSHYSQAGQFSPMSRQASRQGSNQVREGQLPQQAACWPAQSQAVQYMSSHAAGLGSIPTPPGFLTAPPNQHGLSVLQAPHDMQGQIKATIGYGQNDHHTAVPFSLGQSQSVQDCVRPAQGPGQMSSWIGHNLASVHAVPTNQRNRVGPSHIQNHVVSQFSQPADPKLVYPTAAMRSQQLSSSQVSSGIAVQAPLAPFLNEQLRRVLAQSGPSARRGF